MGLSQEKCVPCREGAPRVEGAELEQLGRQVPEWKVVRRDGIDCLERAFEFDDFAQALAFTNKVGALAEAEDHHPAVLTQWGRVTVAFWTHKIRGLHRNDFVSAAKVDGLY